MKYWSPKVVAFLLFKSVWATSKENKDCNNVCRLIRLNIGLHVKESNELLSASNNAASIDDHHHYYKELLVILSDLTHRHADYLEELGPVSFQTFIWFMKGLWMSRAKTLNEYAEAFTPKSHPYAKSIQKEADLYMKKAHRLDNPIDIYSFYSLERGFYIEISNLMRRQSDRFNKFKNSLKSQVYSERSTLYVNLANDIRPL